MALVQDLFLSLCSLCVSSGFEFHAGDWTAAVGAADTAQAEKRGPAAHADKPAGFFGDQKEICFASHQRNYM